MFTIEQIIQAHSKVKSGADFPSYIKEMSGLAISRYEHFVRDGHSVYYGAEGFSLTGPSKYPEEFIHSKPDIPGLTARLKIHQAGKTTYLQFCKEAAAIGVEKWIVDLDSMTCIYYDQQGGELLLEKIPG